MHHKSVFLIAHPTSKKVNLIKMNKYNNYEDWNLWMSSATSMLGSSAIYLVKT